jgi:ribonuclease HI
MAALVALYQIERFVKGEVWSGETRFLIITDSAYLVNSLTSYVYKWRENDYTSSAGKEVVNRDLFEKLDYKLDFMANGRQGLEVLFWKVDRSENAEADILARQGAMM